MTPILRALDRQIREQQQRLRTVKVRTLEPQPIERLQARKTNLSLALLGCCSNRSKMTLVYGSNDLKGAYDFYHQALGKDGWKYTPAMGLENGPMKDGNCEGMYAKE